MDDAKLDQEVVVLVPPASGVDERASSPWPDLLPELAGMVFCRLLSYRDRLRFQAVCRSWRLAAPRQHPLPPPLPWLSLDRATYQSLPDGEVHRLVPDPDDDELPGTVCRGSFDGWLLYHRPPEQPPPQPQRQPECFLRNPLSMAKIALPNHAPVGLCPGGCYDAMCFPKPEEFMRKIIVRSPDHVAAMTDYFILLHLPPKPPQLPYWSFTAATISIDDGGLFTSHHCWRDMALYHGKLYSISTGEELFVHEFSSSEAVSSPSSSTTTATQHRPRYCRGEVVIDTAPPLDDEEHGYYWVRNLHLVESCTGDKPLLMVRWRWRLPAVYDYRHWCADELSKEIKLDVFEADMENRRWSEVEEIGDQAIFLGNTNSKAVPTLPDHGSSIFFLGSIVTDYCLDGIIDGIGDCAYGVYNMKNGTFRFDNPVSIKRDRVPLGLDDDGYPPKRWRPRWIADWFFPS
ncbi:uncharacterized protein [Oryza sativa Japonica Group]|uniref:F-box domain, putative n=3 Tax=Oryza sativa subsp. japonica TaxID=39947 RepID=A0A9K3Y7C7_ORYSJ|nr:F-box domain, putative [Oryza sativa Japonica Group]ABA91522.1 hypothetical protein LOC_Os11g05580 [Oryza sativa Japonica Group]EAZ17474.1 hypothetical protein OsJ_33006 [Oryza sativa Japonica Group]KAF2909576.1 hypothetical protein DAI22_11g036300 [Oryza sativa Japonica Group]USI00823.1 hypothetical protein [Oryza sativa Japonica Group]